MRSQLNRRIVMLEARVPGTRRRKKPLPDWLVAEFVSQGARLKPDGTLELASTGELTSSGSRPSFAAPDVKGRSYLQESSRW